MMAAEEPAHAATTAVLSYALCRVARPAGASVPTEPIDWPLTLARAQALNLLPLLAAALPDLPSAPAATRAALQTAAREQRVRNLLRGEACAAIARRFDAAGIEWLAFKGIALAHSVYPSPSLRYFDDLDLLVRPAQVDDAARVLRELGYGDHPRAPRPDWHHLPPFVHPRHGAMIELHVDLFRRVGDERWPLEAVWQRAVPLTIGGAACRMPEAADALIITALHARHSLFEKALALLDSALLLDRCADWATLVTRAADAGGATPLAHLLARGRQLGLLADAPSLRVNHPSLIASRRLHAGAYLAPLHPVLRSGALPKVTELLLMDNLRARGRLARALLAPRGTLVQAGYRSPAERLWLRSKMAVKQLTAILLRRNAA